MTTQEKLVQLKALLQITDATQDSVLAVFISLARDEILSWLYSGKTPEGVVDVPARYESVQVMAVVVGYSQQGAEGQLHHNENGVIRIWKHDDMVAYIRSRVIPYIGVI